MNDTTKRKKTARTGPVVNRRILLKGGAAAMGAAAAGSLTVFSRRARAADRLRVLSWPGYEEKDVIQEFEDTHGVKVEFKTYIGGEQMLQFFNQTPRGTYDNVLVGRRICPKTCGSRCDRALQSRREITELANYHPKFSNMYQVQAGRRDGLGHARRASASTPSPTTRTT